VYCFVVPPSKISCHWLQPVVDDGTFLSPEFIRRKILEGTSPDAPKIFRQCGSTALQKTIRYSLLATRCRFG
jgi:hypothetical protein